VEEMEDTNAGENFVIAALNLIMNVINHAQVTCVPREVVHQR